jgi:mannose-6-phosphate isomerase
VSEVLYPLRFEPIFQYRIWGGRRLGPWMNATLPGGDDNPIGEAWILSDRDDHANQVAEGPLKGRTIRDLMDEAKTAMLGRLAPRFERFPLLLKFLDVRQMLSVQVHPPDDRHDLIPPGEGGKTEAWVVLEADAESRIYAGLEPHVAAEDLRTLSVATADERLARFQPNVGDGVLIEAGTVHSLGDGVMVFEVQENSDVTFRLYDWDHIDPRTGKRRDLQVEEALACVDFGEGAVLPVTPAVETTAPVRRELCFDNRHFRLWRLKGEAPFKVGAVDEPRVLIGIGGEGHVEHEGGRYALGRGATMLLPASVGVCQFTPSGPVTVLEVAIPEAT